MLVSLKHAQGRITRWNPTGQRGQARAVDMLCNQGFSVSQTQYRTHGPSRMRCRNLLWHFHRRRNNHERDRSMTCGYSQSSSDWQHFFRSAMNSRLHSLLQPSTKKGEVFSINTSVHVAKAIGRRNDAMRGMIQNITKQDFHLGMR